MPRYWGLESRPLRVEPPPFLCAMARSLCLDARDLDPRVALAVAALAAHVLAALEAHRDRLHAADGAEDLALHGGSLHHRLADPDLALVRHEEHALERDRVALLPRTIQVAGDHVAHAHADLARPIRDDGEHSWAPSEKGRRV